MLKDYSEETSQLKPKEPESFLQHLGHEIHAAWDELSGHNSQIRMMKKEEALAESDKKFLPEFSIKDSDADIVTAKKIEAAGDDDDIVKAKKKASTFDDADDLVKAKKKASPFDDADDLVKAKKKALQADDN